MFEESLDRVNLLFARICLVTQNQHDSRCPLKSFHLFGPYFEMSIDTGKTSHLTATAGWSIVYEQLAFDESDLRSSASNIYESQYCCSLYTKLHI